MNCTVRPGVWRRTGGTGNGCKEKMSSSAAASIGKNKIGGIGGDGKNHVAGIIADGSIGMRGKVVKKHVASLFGFYCRRRLVIGNFVQSNNDGGITTAGIVEEEAGNLLNAFDAKFVEEGRDVVVGELQF